MTNNKNINYATPEQQLKKLAEARTVVRNNIDTKIAKC